MKLYHFTAERFLKGIQKDGLTKGHFPLLIKNDEIKLMKNCQWLTKRSGWDQAFHGMPGDSGEMFAASKGAIMAASKSLAHSLAPAVRVNCVAPGWIRTTWGDQASGKWQQTAEQDSLLSRWGTPDDVAQVVSFLASDKSEFINGQVIPINGGFRHSRLEQE